MNKPRKPSRNELRFACLLLVLSGVEIVATVISVTNGSHFHASMNTIGAIGAFTFGRISVRRAADWLEAGEGK